MKPRLGPWHRVVSAQRGEQGWHRVPQKPTTDLYSPRDLGLNPNCNLRVPSRSFLFAFLQNGERAQDTGDGADPRVGHLDPQPGSPW